MPSGWHDSYAIGLPEIDQEHRALVEVIAVLSKGYCERDLVDTQIKILERYIEEHFAREEELMHQTGYPDLESHRDMHHDFTAQVQSMRTRWALDNTPELHAEIAAELGHWMHDHILRVDRAYGPWLRDQAKAK